MANKKHEKHKNGKSSKRLSWGICGTLPLIVKYNAPARLEFQCDGKKKSFKILIEC